MERPNDRISYLKRARRTIRAVALGLVVSGFGTTAALADVCQYSDGTTDNGPCLQFENGSQPCDLYCLWGPTSKSHKIIIRGGDSFTCKVPVDRLRSPIARTNTNNFWSFRYYTCQGYQKQIRKLVLPSQNDLDGKWERECRNLP